LGQSLWKKTKIYGKNVKDGKVNGVTNGETDAIKNKNKKFQITKNRDSNQKRKET
jgi:hypothetical protein